MTEGDAKSYVLRIIDSGTQASWPDGSHPEPIKSYVSNAPYPLIRVGDELGLRLAGGLVPYKVDRVVTCYGDEFETEWSDQVETFIWVTL